jgi:hypothetical protein
MKNFINLLQKWIYHLDGNDTTFIFLVTLLWYLLVFFINLNNKTLIIASMLLLYIYWHRFKHLEFAVLLTFLANSVFSVGKTYTFELLPPGSIPSNLLMNGFLTQIIFGMNDICIIAMVGLLINDLYHKTYRGQLYKPILYLVGFNLLGVFSSLIASRRPDLSFVWSIQNCYFSIVALMTAHLARQKKIFPLILSLIAALTVFEGIVASCQFIHRGYMGSSVESMGYIYGGTSVDEDMFSFRPLGTYTHPNVLAQSAILSIPIFVSLLYDQTAFLPPFIILCSISGGLIALLLSQGRSAWFAVAGTLLVLFYVVEKKWRKKPKIALSLKKSVFLSCLLIIVILFTVPSRLPLLIYSFEESASGSTRLLLIQEWLQLIIRNPFFGVGIGMSVLEGLNQNLFNVLPMFHASVHNIYLIIASEQGIVSMFLFIAYIISTIKLLIRFLTVHIADTSRLLIIGVLCGSIGVYINFLFQPHLDIMMLIIVLQTIILSTYTQL